MVINLRALLLAALPLIGTLAPLQAAWDEEDFKVRIIAAARTLTHAPRHADGALDALACKAYDMRLGAARGMLAPVIDHFQDLRNFTQTPSAEPPRMPAEDEARAAEADKQMELLTYTLFHLGSPSEETYSPSAYQVWCLLAGTTLSQVTVDHTQSPFLTFLKRGLISSISLLTYNNDAIGHIVFSDTLPLSLDILPALPFPRDTEILTVPQGPESTPLEKILWGLEKLALNPALVEDQASFDTYNLFQDAFGKLEETHIKLGPPHAPEALKKRTLQNLKEAGVKAQKAQAALAQTEPLVS